MTATPNDRADGERAAPWKVSLHGGHSGEFCDHADGTLEDMLKAAAAFGYQTFGVSEHAPRMEERFLYPEERARGWTLEKIVSDFDRYAEAVSPLAENFSDRLVVLRGFEAEVVPDTEYIAIMKRLRNRRLPNGRPVFDYFVGSVHYVDERQIDAHPSILADAARAAGGLERLAVRYYESVARMVDALRPDVVGHLDLIKRNAAAAGLDRQEAETVRCRAAAGDALETILRAGSILDLNTAGWRKGLGEPYPAPWLVRMAASLGVGFCFGDDSHRPSEVGNGVYAAAAYLRNLGVGEITVLTREGGLKTGEVVKRTVALPI